MWKVKRCSKIQFLRPIGQQQQQENDSNDDNDDEEEEDDDDEEEDDADDEDEGLLQDPLKNVAHIFVKK